MNEWLTSPSIPLDNPYHAVSSLCDIDSVVSRPRTFTDSARKERKAKNKQQRNSRKKNRRK